MQRQTAPSVDLEISFPVGSQSEPGPLNDFSVFWDLQVAYSDMFYGWKCSNLWRKKWLKFLLVWQWMTLPHHILFRVAAAIPAVLFLAPSFPTFPNFQPHTFIPHCTCCDNHIPHACILLNDRFSFTKWCWKCVCSSLCCFDLDLPAAGGQGSDDFAEPLHDNRVCKL